MWIKQQILSQTDLESCTLALLVFHLGHMSSSPWDLVLSSVKWASYIHCGTMRALDTEHANCLAGFLVLTKSEEFVLLKPNKRKETNKKVA